MFVIALVLNSVDMDLSDGLAIGHHAKIGSTFYNFHMASGSGT